MISLSMMFFIITHPIFKGRCEIVTHFYSIYYCPKYFSYTYLLIGNTLTKPCVSVRAHIEEWLIDGIHSV